MKLFDCSILNRITEKRTDMMGIAMLLVLMYHYALNFGIYHSPIIVRGDIGVDIFFFLSGYGCCYSANKHGLKDFYKRRMMRILPIYVVIEIVVILCDYELRGTQFGGDTFLRLMCVSFFLNGDLSVWYIHASLALYAITPFVVFMFKKYDLKFFYLLVSSVSILVYLCAIYGKANLNIMIYRIPVYMYGICMALAKMQKIAVSQNKIMGGVFLYLVLIIVAQIVLKEKGMLIHNQLRYIIYPIIVTFFILGCLFLPKYHILSWLGNCSLECYLVHQPIMLYLSFINNKVLFVGSSIVTICLFTWVFHLLNNRFSSLLKSFF